MDERRGVVKTPTADEEKELSRRKEEAYILLAKQMQETEDFEVVMATHAEPGSTKQLS